VSRSFGRTVPLSLARRFIGDLMHVAASVPSVPMQRRMHLAPLVAARSALRQRIGWCALFTKAFAMVAARRPELRRAYMNFPRPRLFEHADNFAAIAVEREYDGDKSAFFAHIRAPERWELSALEARLRFFKEAELSRVRSFRRALRYSGWPLVCRRLMWWYGLNVSGRARAKYLGSFGVSSTAGEGASQLSLWTPLTTSLFYSPFSADGSIDVRLVFDHRVFDGCVAARALAEVEKTLLGEILTEVNHLCRANAA